ncbi:adhesin transport system membrane fusion protein [Kushneria sinocarnis]|uniref:Membrane fusion protein (MFP) family protein n=1 Tax=Kushneria sinocarnis TaxID=595502 RepID=A0A420WZZ5_9GAMM|nr:HlyD family type I secretion periplasmic adaptor subunit [Kushneria sinocarnis]RKR06872.1 adhesin transport system membrane fusion protein [Kushneria sinocarnis]
MARMAERRRRSRLSRQETELVDDASAAMLLATPWRSRVLLWVLLAVLVSFLVWASLARIEIVARGTGQVVPSTRLQTIQNLEGGIIRDIYIQEGDVVAPGQPLARIDPTRASSDLAERESTLAGMRASIAQYHAELASVGIATGADAWQDQVTVEHQPLDLGENFREHNGELYQAARSAYEARLSGLETQLSQAGQVIRQRAEELRELKGRAASLASSLALLQKQLDITTPLVKEGVVSRMDLLQIQREVNDKRGELQSTRLSIPAKQAEYGQAISKRNDLASQFRSRAADALNEVQGKLESLQQGRTSLQDRVDRTLVTSPVQGIVRSINVNTIGGVVDPGASLMEIVPIEDQLQVEARVQPRDIGFIHQGQPATVKLSAYDFTVYGGLRGTVTRISPDTVQDQEGNSFYEITVRTQSNHLGSDASPLPIIPGMQATVDVLTGEQTVLQYLLKPILRAQQGALRER